jgi:hypothetical protein
MANKAQLSSTKTRAAGSNLYEVLFIVPPESPDFIDCYHTYRDCQVKIQQSYRQKTQPN